MGAKYLPTKKDLKASQRYQNNHNPLPHTRKSSTALPKKKDLASKSDASVSGEKNA